MEKAKEEENMSKEFAAMEEAAMKAYQEDMKRLGIKPGSSYSCQKIKDRYWIGKFCLKLGLGPREKASRTVAHFKKMESANCPQ